jgi:hypothetical protein
VAHVLRIDPHHAGLDALREAMRAADILGPQIRREPVAHVIGDGERFLLVGERDHGQHRPEDFLLRDPHGVVRPEIERRAHEVALLARAPAADDRRAFLLGGFDIGQNLLDVARVDQRADLGRGIERMADLDLLDARGGAPGKLLVDRGFDQRPARRGAALAVERVDHEQHRVERAVEVRVGEHHHGVLAAELEMHAL